jgi:hypothetical protein
MVYFRVDISQASVFENPPGSGDVHNEVFNNESFRFKSMTEAREFIDERYGKEDQEGLDVESRSIYRDTSGGSVVVGLVFQVHSEDSENSMREDWVEVSVVDERPVPFWVSDMG